MTAQPSADLEVYQPPALAVVPPAEGNDFDSWIAVAGQVVKLAREICDTPFVPDGLRGSAPAVAAAILAGRELGLPPITALQHTHVIKGKIGHSALLMRALIMAEGHDWVDVDVSDVRAVVKGRRKGEAEWAEAQFTADQAKRAGIQLGGYPQDKLYARATVRLARRKFADVILGMPHAAEELEDGDVPGDVPAPAAAQNGNAQESPKPAAQKARRKTAAAGDDTHSRSRSAGVPAPAQDGTAGDSTAQDATPRAAGAAPSRGAQPLPPLPGEDDETPAAAVPDETPASGPAAAAGPEPGEEPDETDYDTPGTATNPQIGAIWTVLSTVYKFSKDEKDQARAVCAHIAGHPLESTRNMSRNEAKAVLDTLASWREVAERHDEQPREFLIELLAKAQEEAGGDG